ncbi:MAG: 50S ribosomal protein L21 [Candidatus Sumerlaeia bacterium]|nr:50S ribosomal protein L21 [Candidatus Sumerlaeia bacterium]
MYAVLRQGGHQYGVQPGEVIQIEKLDTADDEIVLEDVLAVHDGETLTLGEPRVENAVVKAKVLRNGKAKKITVYKFKRRKGYSRKLGHRQPFTEIKILSIAVDGKELAAAN